MKKIILKIFIIICLTGVIYYSYKIVSWKMDVDENKKIEELINEKVNIVPSTNTNKEEFNIDFNSLININKDTVGFLKVNNTNIKHIVVKGKDNSYYLKHNYEKKYNSAGWIFADYHNKFDGNDKNIVIYGHSMKNGSMFGTLKNVLKKDWYTKEENKNITLFTNDKKYSYIVFSVYTIKSENYYINTEFNSENEYEKFINTIKSRSIYDFKTDVDKNDRILTLSTCAPGGNKRVVLHAKMIDD